MHMQLFYALLIRVAISSPYIAWPAKQKWPLGTNQPRELKRHALGISRCSPAMPLLLISLNPIHFRRAMTRSDPHRKFHACKSAEMSTGVKFWNNSKESIALSTGRLVHHSRPCIDR